jgi:hypothetical protein
MSEEETFLGETTYYSLYDNWYFNRDMQLSNEYLARVNSKKAISPEEQQVYNEATTRLMQYNLHLENFNTNIWKRYAQVTIPTGAAAPVSIVNTTVSEQPDNNGSNPSGAAWYNQTWQGIKTANPDWTDQQVYDELTRQINEADWNARYQNIITDIANSSTPAERDQKINYYKSELAAFRASKIDVDNDLTYLRNIQGEANTGLFETLKTELQKGLTALSSSVEAEYLLPPDNQVDVEREPTVQEMAIGITRVRYDDGTSALVNAAGIPLSEEIQKSDDRNRVTVQSVWDTVGGYIKNWQLWQGNQADEFYRNMAKHELAMFDEVEPTDPQYELKLQEKMSMLKEVNDSVVPGGMKFVRGFNGAIKGLSKAGEGILKGSVDGLTVAERKVVGELVSQGKTVEIIPKTTQAKTSDFFVDAVKTELKTLQNPNTGTGMKRIQEGFGQGAEKVIIDARESGLTSSQAQEIINRALGKYPGGQLPGHVEIWTGEGIITYIP